MSYGRTLVVLASDPSTKEAIDWAMFIDFFVSVEKVDTTESPNMQYTRYAISGMGSSCEARTGEVEAIRLAMQKQISRPAEMN